MTVVLAFVVGAAIGGFLNAGIRDLPLGRAVVWPSPSCASCGRRRPWLANIPVAGWLAARRCRSCGAPVPGREPIIELVTATLFAAALWYYGPTALFASRVVLGCALIVLFVVDLDHRILPNVITLPGIVIGFAFSVVTGPGWLSSLVGIAAGGGILFATAEAYYRVRNAEGLGMGDVKMLAMIGAFLGWPATLMTLMIGSMAGSLIGLMMIVFRRGDLQYGLPFGTFLAIGAALSATIGPLIIDWYSKQ